MAQLSTEPTSSSCCATEAQASCCEPSEKASCCDTSAAGGSCGCSAGAPSADIRESVRERYAAAARTVAEQSPSASCCGSVALAEADEAGLFGVTLYEGAETEGAPDAALGASLGCGVPTAVADLHGGETVRDLGSGAGADVLIARA